MRVEVDVSSPVPAFEQVRTQIATMAETGVLAVGARLPSIRQLAADLGLAPGTVARAYRELESDGIVISRVRHGTTIQPRSGLSDAERHRRLTEAAQTFAASARILGADESTALAAARTALQSPQP